jgi:hypothetical protein
MGTWSNDELRRIPDTDDLHVAPLWDGEVTYGTPTWIWSVVVEDALYVRAYNGVDSRWYRAALRQKAGRITAAGLTKTVYFEGGTGAINDRIADACRAKYRANPYLEAMLGAGPGAARVRVSPRAPEAQG